jgi:diguanylate cyclase (GGDEF)-like protein
MIDIDHFKKVNDAYGHTVGDEVLKYVADGLSDKLRSIDTLSRFGGEEFVIIMPETALDGSAPALERMRKKFETRNFLGNGDISLNVTVSIGLAEYPSHGDTPAKLIESADTALYSAKEAGRNRLQKFSL